MSGPSYGAGAAAGPSVEAYWATINPAHAVQTAAAVITFAEEVTSFVVKRIVDALRPEAHKFRLFKEDKVNTVVFQIKPGGAMEKPAENQTGIAFQETLGAGVLQALTVTTESIRFETSSYTRWVAFREQLFHFLKVALPIVSQSTPVSAIGLEYTDFFYARNEGAADVGLIIDKGSRLIAARAFRRRDPFHSNSGWFDQETVGGRHLVNVDLAVNDAAGPDGIRRAITLRTFESEQVLDPTSDRALELTQADLVLLGMDRLHDSLKRRVGETLTRDAVRMISLNSK
jgi:uncharacterized protein (TIGR04255 family)